MYDAVIVGAGLFGAVCARELTDRGRKVTVIEREAEPGGMCRDEWDAGILVHKHGPHIFHTNNLEVWQYVQRFDEWRHYNQFDLASWRGGLYSFPVNLLTLHQIFGITTPEEAECYFRSLPKVEEKTFEDVALNRYGETLYEMFIRDYTVKQWGRLPKDLPASIIRRVPVRTTFDARYHDALYQGLPEHGYSAMIAKLLDGVDVLYNTDYNDHRQAFSNSRDIIYSGSVDDLFKGCKGMLEYRTLDFRHETFTGDYQGASVIRYTGGEVSYTRVIEHKFFDTRYHTTDKTVVTWETPREWKDGDERYYPIPDEQNEKLAAYYKGRARNEGYILGGRLGSYRYMNMDQVIAQALLTVKKVQNA